jgi:integrase
MSCGLAAKRQKIAANRYLPVLSSDTICSSSDKKSQQGKRPLFSASTQQKRQSRGGGARKSKSKPVESTAHRAEEIRRSVLRHQHLKTLRVQDKTLIRYHESVCQFDEYLKRRRLKPKRLDDVDKRMAEYFADICEQGSSYHNATYVLFGFLMLRADDPRPDKQLMSYSRAALKGWSSRYPQASRTGAVPAIWQLIAMHMSEESPPLAAAVMIQLDTYLRPSEVLSLRKDDVFKPVKKRCQYWGVVVGNSQRNQVTKTGMQDDTVLLNSEDRAYTADILSLVYHRAKGPSARLFGDVTLSQYEELMRKARIKAGLGHYQLTPHAIRHSGPSIDCLQRTRSCDEVMARGRWKTIKSIQRYQKPGQLLLKMNKIPQRVWDHANKALPTLLARLKQYYRGG